MAATLWLLGDQLSEHYPIFSESAQPEGLQILMIESAARLARLPYHRKKLVLLVGAMYHRAQSLREEKYVVDFRSGSDMPSALSAHLEAYHPDRLIMIKANSQRGRFFQKSLVGGLGIPVEILPNTHFLCQRVTPLPDVGPDEDVRQETFYRAMRRRFGLLVDEDGRPLGGQWNFDKQNRQPLPTDANLSAPVRFAPDETTNQVIERFRRDEQGFGWSDGFNLGVTPGEAERAAEDFFNNRLVHFGSYEDAMSRDHAVLYHSKLALYLNLGLLDPLELARRAEAAYLDGRVTINNAEGFIRQVIGWREYMFWQYERLMPELAQENALQAERPLPGFFWTGDTDMNCLKHVLQRVIQDGYAHHIERLMLLSNFCTLAGIRPGAVLNWFQSVFIDAYEWVMVPNVMGMGLYADGGRIGTKPYISSANYINKMGNYCGDCRYDKNQRTGEEACPFNFLYWGFLLRHEARLRENPRMARMLSNLKFLDDDERKRVQQDVEKFLSHDLQC